MERKVRDPLTGKRRSAYGYSEAELQADIRRILGLAPEAADGSFSSFYLDVYLPTVSDLSQNWLNQISYCMDKYFLPEFGHVPIDEIERRDLQMAFNKWKLGLATKRRFKIVASGVFNLAVSDGVIPRNPCRDVRIPSPTAPVKTALSPEQLWHLYTVSEGRARSMVILGGFLGLRSGEALGTSKQCLRNGVLSVERQVLQFIKSQAESIPPHHYEELRGGVVVTRRLKTPQSTRKVPVPEALAKELLEGAGSALWLVPDENGWVTAPNNADRELRATVAAAQKQDESFPRVTMHELRHTWLTMMESVLEAPDSIRLEIAGKKKQGADADYLHPQMARKAKWMERYWELVSTSAVVKPVVREAK